MRQPVPESLWQKLSAAENLADRWLCGADASLPLEALTRGSSFGGRLDELRGRSVLVATKDQLPAALALIELDGVARRIVLCPPDLPPEYIPSIIATASVDAFVGDPRAAEPGAESVGCVVTCTPSLCARRTRPSRERTNRMDPADIGDHRRPEIGRP